MQIFPSANATTKTPNYFSIPNFHSVKLKVLFLIFKIKKTCWINEFTKQQHECGAGKGLFLSFYFVCLNVCWAEKKWKTVSIWEINN